MTNCVEIQLIYTDLIDHSENNGFYSYFAKVDDETIRDFIIETRVGKATYETWQPLAKHFFWLAIQYIFNFEDMVCAQALENSDNFMNWLQEHCRNKAQECYDKEQNELY